MERTRISPTGRLEARDPQGDALEEALAALVADLTAAAAAAEALAGAPPAGVRAVEMAPGERRFLCAFAGPRFLCLDAARSPLRDPRSARQTAVVGLAWEHLEAIVDVDRLEDLAAAGGRLLALADGPPAMTDAIAAVVAAGTALAGWRASPLRAEASLPQVDVASALQERAYRAYGVFVASSEHLVGVQDRLAPELVQALRGFEEAAGRAAVVERLADRVGQVVAGCDEAADEMLAAHVTPLPPA